MIRLYTVLIYFLYCSPNFLSYALQCRDPNNNPVDWYVIYKLPKEHTHSNNFIKNGLAFLYMTSNNYTDWIFSEVDINDSNSMVAKTLNGLFSKNQEQNLYVLYNDQPPYGSKATDKGHTKGVVMADGNEGFWLIHSVPHFPWSLESYMYPHTGIHYGQSFLCISLDIKNLNSVGLQLQYNEPHIYAQNIPHSMAQAVPEILKAAQNQTIENAPWYNAENITSSGGTKFVSFAKSGKFKKDLYSDLVSANLQSDLYVETWPNEPNRLPSNCDKKYQVDNILSISVPQLFLSFPTTVDHSKWAVSAPNDSTEWICIGDINRAERQTERGGGTTCLNNKLLTKQYQNVVSSVQPCTNRIPHTNAELRDEMTWRDPMPMLA